MRVRDSLPGEVASFHDLPSTWRSAWLRRREPPPDPAPAVLRELRDARFRRGACCPHCRSTRVQRWGSFSGRQRYRCRDCRRTSSDLTGTPLAYSKRPALWGEFAGCMLESLSVRAAGRRLGIDKDTAWRWRHALLDGHAEATPPALSGVVETCEYSLPFNEKGKRLPSRETPPRRRRRQYGSPNRRRVWILVARDRAAHAAAIARPGARPGRQEVSELLRRPRQVRALLHRYGPFGACGMFAIPRGIELVRVADAAAPPRDGSLYHLQSVLGYQQRLRSWLRQFRGVATWYLPNYLHWYALLEGLGRPATTLLLDACSGLAPRIPRNRAPKRGDAAEPQEPNSSRGQRARARAGTPPPPSVASTSPGSLTASVTGIPPRGRLAADASAPAGARAAPAMAVTPAQAAEPAGSPSDRARPTAPPGRARTPAASPRRGRGAGAASSSRA